MKLLKGITYILLFYFLGEIVSHFTGKIIPGNVCGMILLFLALTARIIKPEDVKTTANILTRNMALFFVPAGVGLMAEYNIIARNWAALLVVSIVTTILVMIVVGYVQEKVEVRTRRHLHIGIPFK